MQFSYTYCVLARRVKASTHCETSQRRHVASSEQVASNVSSMGENDALNTRES